MTTFSQLTWWTVPGFVAGLAAVYAFAFALFRSMPADELRNRIGRWSRRLARMRTIQWELTANTKRTDRTASGDAFAARPPLTDDERARLVSELDALTNQTVAIRAVVYLFNCSLCQFAWSSIVLLAVNGTRGLELVMSVCCYAGLLSLISSTFTRRQPAEQPRKSCGG